MIPVHAKKRLGQHFLNDENIALKITESIQVPCENLLEVGPGTGVLTKYLLKKLSAVSYQLSANNPESGIQNPEFSHFLALDVDHESIAYLKQMYPDHANVFLEADFLKFDPEKYFNGCFTVIGNFPYNISSQIFFKVLDHVDLIPEVVCMLQKEVAERIASPPGNKAYGILSVLLQAWYRIDYLFTVSEHVFIPPPKVKSAVIRLTRNETTDLGCNPAVFKQIIKTAFNQRRKTLRNALKSISFIHSPELEELKTKRAEQLGVKEFVFLANAAKM
ncbi:MAG TPA: 16S rRNA (adenine(1518)-N(6)/adenine(1519)-N(6))-dimethyltransferase RsmA [Lentimicrobium sp.]|nr:16S rRNA (adenine(1518)-N(6)/adenine(1519)-N(6))-dimethyltransferase RsmA [Lentimicrobium sp.]